MFVLMRGEDTASVEFAKSLVDVRLLQTAKLLEWMLEQGDADVDAVKRALGSVMNARDSIDGVRAGGTSE